MAYACDRLYDEVIRKIMPDLSTKVKVREIVSHLACLTISDREEIEAKREMSGNYCAMSVLLDNLRRRENWPVQFISALKKCEQWALADRISKDYDRIRGIHTQKTDTSVASVSPAALPAPAPAPTAAAPIPAPFQAEASATVTTATIHKVPHSTQPLLTPSVEIEVSALVPAPNAQVHTPESAQPAKHPLLVLPPDARPPSPVSAPALTPSVEQSEVTVGTRESSKLGISGVSLALTEAPAIVSVLDTSVHPHHEPAHLAEPPLMVLASDAMPSSQVSAPKVIPSVEQNEVIVIPRDTPILDISGGLTHTALSGPSSIASNLPSTPASTSSQVNKHATISQSAASQKREVLLSSSVKDPIQDTDPPKKVLARDLQNYPTINQVGERLQTALSPNCQTQETSQGTAQAPPSTSTDAVAGCLTNFTAENEENFSKPGVLRGEESFSVSSDISLQISRMTMNHLPVQPARPQTVPIPHRGEKPFNASVSVNTDNLMISTSTTTILSQSVSDHVAPVQNSSPRAFRNGFPEGDSSSYPHQPVEDYYESLQVEPGTRVNIVEFSEEPSLQNLNSQPSSIVGQTTTGLIHNRETVSLAWSVSEAQPSQGSQSIQRNNSSEQAMNLASLTTYAEPASATFQESELNASSQTNIPQSEQREESHGVLHQLQSNSHLIAAAAIGMTALFVALRLKY